MEEFSLKGKVIVVTGGTGILGDSFIKGIVKAGGAVGILGRNKDVANERADAINKAGGRAVALIADAMDESQLIDAKNKVLDTFGRIDGLVNGAGGNQPGATIGPDKTIFDLNVEAFKQVVDLNLFGTVIPTMVFAKIMADQKQGNIINISSEAAIRPLTRVVGYAAAKAAVTNFTKYMAIELATKYGEGLRVNAFAPGFFISEQNRALLTNPDGSLTARGNTIVAHTPFGRFGEPEELLGTLHWLASDASKFVTGTLTVIDGGFDAFCI